ncbi:MAG: hypothetical protein KIT84_43260 [Labilithrix sp.]|nr:hypothetical protein [Labilithrix sp.]MCW5817897.1 hypothetical protein [Labilithrix sp.]
MTRASTPAIVGLVLITFARIGLTVSCGDPEVAATMGDADAGDDNAVDGATRDAVDGSAMSDDATVDAATDAAAAHPVVVAGTTHTCSLLRHGVVKCWGDNRFGRLGLGKIDSYVSSPKTLGADFPPVVLGAGRVATQIAVGYGHACAVLDGGKLKCWGENFSGELGIGERLERGSKIEHMGANLPEVDLGEGRSVRQVAAGSESTCAILDDGSVKCWGRNDVGQLGLGDTRPRGRAPEDMGANLPPVDLGPGRIARSISLGVRHACAVLDDASVKCWGANMIGQLGLGDVVDRGTAPEHMGANLPRVDLGPGRTARAVAAGDGHTCALLDDATVKCWGNNVRGALGLGDTKIRGGLSGEMGANLPAVRLDRPARYVGSGRFFSCALLDDGAVKCWGDNKSGQLGLGDTSPRGDQPAETSFASVDLGPGRFARQLSVGHEYVCASLDDRTIKCWGYNGYYNLGIADRANRGDMPGEMGTELFGLRLE